MPKTELPDFIGHRIGTFFVLSKLGQGSFGAVYKVKLDNGRGSSGSRSSSSGFSALTTTVSMEEERDSDIHAHLATISGEARHRTYALKITPLKAYEAMRRALGEYEHILHARCGGVDGVLPLYASFPVEYKGGKYFCLVLEYVEGGSLLDLITTKGVLYRDDALVRDVFAQIVGAVRGCHERGVYHRDLKPENVLVTTDYKVYIADFGLATDKRRSRHFSTGSKLYISPECAGILVPLNSEFDHEYSPGPRTLLKDCHVPDGVKDSYDTALNDVWSLGIILFNMVAGSPPWSRADPGSESFLMSYRHAGQFLRGRYPLSSALNALLMRVLELRPGRRIKLYELERSVRMMGTFFMSKEELTSPRFEVARKRDETYGRQREVYFVKRNLELLGFAPLRHGCELTGEVRGEVRKLPAAAGVAHKERERNTRKQQQEPVEAPPPPPPSLPQRPQGTATRIMAIARQHIRVPFTVKNKLSNNNNNKNADDKKTEPSNWSDRDKALPRRPVLTSSTWSTSSEVDISAPKTPTAEERCGVVGEPRIAAEELAELARGFLGDVDGGDTAAKARAASARVVLTVAAPAEGAMTATAAAELELAAREEARGLIKIPPMAYYARGKSRSKG